MDNDTISCNALISACAASSEWPKALHWLCTMLHRDQISDWDASCCYFKEFVMENQEVLEVNIVGKGPFSIAMLNCRMV